MKSIRLILFGVFLLLLLSVILQIFQKHSWNISHFEICPVHFICHMVANEYTDEKHCCISNQNKKDAMSDKIWQIGLTVLGGVITGAIGLIVGWLLNKWQRRDERMREAENRRRNFLAEMDRIRHQASFVVYDNMGEFYKNLLPQISYQVGLIRGDFDHVAAGFDEYRIALYRLDEAKINEPYNQMQIMQVIDNFIGFVERNHIKNP